MVSVPLGLSREQILVHRRRVTHLDVRLARPTAALLRKAAWAGLQDSMPRAAVLQIHARVGGVTPEVLDDDALVQVWGPRYSTYVVAARDRAVFTLGRLPVDEAGLARAIETANRLEALLGSDGQERTYSAAGRALGVNPNALRYGGTTGRLLIGWEGSGKPTVRVVPAPDVDPWTARLELARRYLHIFGPSTAESYAQWAGIKPAMANQVFDRLRRSLTPVRTPIAEAVTLTKDAEAFSTVATVAAEPPAGVRLLPSGDTYYLLQGDERTLLVPKVADRDRLWTSRVWPGAVMADGDIVGTWRRSGSRFTVEPWRRLSAVTRLAVEHEAESLPLPLPTEKPITVAWG